MIIIQKLEKEYGDSLVLTELNLQLEANSINGFIEENGCGKTR